MPGYAVCWRCRRQLEEAGCPVCRQGRHSSQLPAWDTGQQITYLSHLSFSFGSQVLEPKDATYLGPAPGGRILIEFLMPDKRARRGITAATRVQMRVLPTEVYKRSGGDCA